MKQTIRLSESELKNMIAESIGKLLKETRLDPEDNYPRLPCEKSRPGDDIPPGDEDIYYPGDVPPDARPTYEEPFFEMIKRCVRKEIYENIRREHMVNAISGNIFRKLFEDKGKLDMKRNAVMKALKDPKYNHAQLAYALWPDMDKDTARSLFAKKANGTPDNDGVIRNFTDEEINTLYQLIRKR